MNQLYLDTARLLVQVAPLVFSDDTFELKGTRYCVGLRQHTMSDVIAGVPAQYVPRLKRLTSVLDVYKILYEVK